MAKMKVFEIIADSSLSGAPLHLWTLLKKIDKSQFSITLICPCGWLADEAEKLGIITVKIPFKGFTDYSSIAKLKKEIERLNPDIIHLHGIRAGWLGVLAARRLKNRIIYTEHLYTKTYHLESRLREWAQLRGLSYILKNVRTILTPSNAVKEFLADKFGINKRKIIVVYNGLEDVQIDRIKEEEKIGFIGSLNIQKGVDDLTKAFSRVKKAHPEISLEIIGDGPLKRELKEKARKISNKIYFLGTKKDFWKYINRWKMVIMPSHSESFGQTALGAAILRKPVVATDVGGLPEVVKDHKTGLLVKACNPKSLAQAINYLLEHENEAKEMGERGRLRYEKLFTAEKMVNRTEEIYQRLGVYEFNKI
ncbi:MAG: glycosyltransferase family 4 protein [Candidatus Berkelbacteria bacterium]|nr:glycosyltransferase family 4 protein [Candidatus Berkelbacteria bacterium]